MDNRDECALQSTLYANLPSLRSAQLNALSNGAGGTMTRILGIILPLGFFCQFVVGYVVDSWGLSVALLAMWTVGVVLATLQLVPIVPIQVRERTSEKFLHALTCIFHNVSLSCLWYLSCIALLCSRVLRTT